MGERVWRVRVWLGTFEKREERESRKRKIRKKGKIGKKADRKEVR